LRILGTLDALEDVTLDGLRLGEHALLGLQGAPRLTRLRLRGCATLPDAALQHLGALPLLAELDLAGCKSLTARGLQALSRHARLATLSLAQCALGPPAIAIIAQLRGLTSLDLSGLILPDEALTLLHALPHLRRLRLAWNAAASAPVSLPSLRLLDVAGCEKMAVRGWADEDEAAVAEALDAPFLDRCLALDA
jgi:hypothetical protein